MSDEQNPERPAPADAPDHTIESARIESDGEPPRVFAVADLKAYLKPEMAEELSSSTGGAAEPGTPMVCRCVPVELCACDTVSYSQGANPCPSNCSCVGDTCYSCRYWHPY